ncbi:response regulator [Altericroceibacterium xinjiangense]|uniref:response regulator n=1 Tax=Altericroceibacterium xinjiangense TaxID=762261 RepID=UPI001F498459|nr:response regulator [Altericroceibacterium xinjiangense]
MADLATDTGLGGLRVLVIEDEPLISMLLEEMLLDLECEVVGPFADYDSASEASQGGGFDVALLDLDLAGRNTDPIAGELARRNHPFAIASGAPPATDHGAAAVLPKPFTMDRLAAVLRDLRASLTN